MEVATEAGALRDSVVVAFPVYGDPGCVRLRWAPENPYCTTEEVASLQRQESLGDQNDIGLCCKRWACESYKDYEQIRYTYPLEDMVRQI